MVASSRMHQEAISLISTVCRPLSPHRAILTISASTLLAIDLSSDWTNSSVNIRSNYKPSGVPDLDDGGIWVDQTNNLLYTGFAGRQSTFGDNSYQEYGLWSVSEDECCLPR
jgi:hypothetical protein